MKHIIEDIIGAVCLFGIFYLALLLPLVLE